jgi:hypothetical protein
VTSTLSVRDLNRTTLARQLLLEPSRMSAHEATGALVGLQSQQPIAPFIGLWSRLDSFKREDLAGPIADRSIVKATTMRATLHLMTAPDYLELRAALQPQLTDALESITRRRGANPPVAALVEHARAFLAPEPRSYAELTTFLTGLYPTGDPGAMRYAVRTHLPLVQFPTDATWCFPGNPKFTLAESWLGESIPMVDRTEALIRRYLRAFGPASVQDVQTWSGLKNLRPTIAEMDDLITVTLDGKKQLLDVADGIYADGTDPAPIRFLPEYDNLLRAFHVRHRVIADEHKPRVYLPALRLAATVLVDGFVAGVWRIETTRQQSTLIVEPFTNWTTARREEATAIAERLIAFAAPTATSRAVTFTST